MTIKTVTFKIQRAPKVSELVSGYVNHIHPGKPFTLEQLASKYDLSNTDRQAASKALQRLVADKKVTRLAKGTYYRPKISRFGPLPLDTLEIVKVVTKTKKATIVPAGAAAVNQLGLDTQLPMVLNYYVSVRTRTQLTHNSVKFQYKETLQYFVHNLKIGNKETKNTALLIWSALTYLESSAQPLYLKKLLKKFRQEFKPELQAKFISALPPSMRWAKELFESTTMDKE